ncbi:MAG TPA: hypothetical protein VF132_05695 [Rudaea sp.]
MSRLFVLMLVGFVVSVASPPARAIQLPWYEGVFQNIGTDFNCIVGTPEIRVQGYAAQTWHDAHNPPAVGDVFYAQVVLSHPGNPCAGSAVGLEILLPPGVTPAISAGNPVFCFAYAPPNTQHSNAILYNLANDSGYGCPQALPQGLQGLSIAAPRGGVGGGAWGMAFGFWLEILVPLRATSAQVGTNQIAFRVNPDLGVVGYPSVPVFVDGDVIFRNSMEDQQVTLDICTVTPIASGC